MLSDTPRTFIGITTFTITGMTCAHCARAVFDEISAIDGLTDVRVDLASGRCSVNATEPVDRTDIARAVDRAGHTFLP